jgi:Cupredoxin-like domain
MKSNLNKQTTRRPPAGLKRILPLAFSAAAILSSATVPARAFWLWGKPKSLPVYAIAIQGRSFVPAVLSVPADTQFKLIVANKNAKPSEFESFSLHREQVVTPGSETTVFLGPLAAGRYGFFDDFQAGVKGTLEVVVSTAAGGKR